MDNKNKYHITRYLIFAEEWISLHKTRTYDEVDWRIKDGRNLVFNIQKIEYLVKVRLQKNMDKGIIEELINLHILGLNKM
jgi:hypothetical protein